MSKFFCRKKEPSTGEYMYFGSFFFNTTHINPVKSLRNVRVETDFWIIDDIKKRDGIENLFVFDTLSELEMNLNLYFRGIRKSKSYDKEIDNYVPDHYTIEPYEHWEKGIEIIENKYVSDSLYKNLDERDEMATYDYSSKGLFKIIDSENNEWINNYGNKEEHELLELDKNKLIQDAAKLSSKILVNANFEELQKEGNKDFERVSHLLKNLLKFEYSIEFTDVNFSEKEIVDTYFSEVNKKEPIAFVVKINEKEFWLLPVEITFNSDTGEADSIRGYIKIVATEEKPKNILVCNYKLDVNDNENLKGISLSLIKRSDFEAYKKAKEKDGKYKVEILENDEDLKKIGITGERLYSNINPDDFKIELPRQLHKHFSDVTQTKDITAGENIKNPLTHEIMKALDFVNNMNKPIEDHDEIPENIVLVEKEHERKVPTSEGKGFDHPKHFETPCGG